jgi:hypothetical protein
MAFLRSVLVWIEVCDRRGNRDTTLARIHPNSDRRDVPLISVVPVETAKPNGLATGVFPKGPVMPAIPAESQDCVTQSENLRQVAMAPHSRCKNYKSPRKTAQGLL